MAAEVLRRAFDLGVGGTALVGSLPLIALGCLAVVLEDGGPPFFVQPRVGRHGRVFPCLKIRTMRRGAHEEPGPCPPPASDPRLLRCGTWLRRWALDELPQLVNVLRGEMSLVGPRPAQPWEAAEHDRRARRRLEVLPGLTGLAQVSGRNRLTWAERIELDLDYVRRRSLGLDLWILAWTVPQLLDRTGAFGGEAPEGAGEATRFPGKVAPAAPPRGR